MAEKPVVELFSGAGGMALGFRAAGARCVGAVDADAIAADTFSRMFAQDEPRVRGGVEGDVNCIDPEEFLGSLRESPDYVVGGPPCQGFSRIGRAKHASLLDHQERVLTGGQGDPSRNLLYRWFLAVVSRARPKAFVMENVPGMQSVLGNDLAGRIAREAASLGYNVRYFLLNAAWYGVPQNRWRLVFVGLRRDLGALAVPRPPVRTYRGPDLPGDSSGYPEDPWFISGAAIPVAPGAKPAVTVLEALGDLPRLTGHLAGAATPEPELPYRTAPGPYAATMRTWPGLPHSTLSTDNWYRVNERDFDIFREMAQGDRYPDALAIADRLFSARLASMASAPAPGSAPWNRLRASIIPPYRCDAFDDKWRKLIADQPSWTVTAHLQKDGYSHIHPDGRQARTITVREAARLQSFPDSFRFQGNNGQRFRQIGNAVPPMLARAIAAAVFEQVQQAETQVRHTP